MAETESKRRMAGPDGKLYDIPFSQVEQAHKDGLEFTTDMVDPKDNYKTYSIPNSKIETARKDGLSDFDAPPTITTPYESKLHADEVKAREDNKSLWTKTKEGFEDEFLSGGASDIRNLPMALGPLGMEAEAGIVGVGNLLARGAVRAEKLWDAATKARMGTRSFQRSTGLLDQYGKPLMDEVSFAYKQAPSIVEKTLEGTKSVAGKTGKKIVSLGKWLGDKAWKLGAGATGGYVAGRTMNEAKEQLEE